MVNLLTLPSDRITINSTQNRYQFLNYLSKIQPKLTFILELFNPKLGLTKMITNF